MDNAKRRRGDLFPAVTPAPAHVVRGDPLRAVIGFEPKVEDDAKRALTDAITNISPEGEAMTQVKRELPTTTTITATVTGLATFYSCRDGWVLSSGVSETGSATGSGGLVPTVSGGSGEYVCSRSIPC